jgi:uncharacterized membrane protein
MNESVRELFEQAVDTAAWAMEVVATLIVTVGAASALWRLAGRSARANDLVATRKQIWRQFGVSLLLGLEFMLAADIVRTAISPTWQRIGQLAAIAAVRTFLSYFLERDLEQTAAAEPGAPRSPPPFESAA